MSIKRAYMDNRTERSQRGQTGVQRMLEEENRQLMQELRMLENEIDSLKID